MDEVFGGKLRVRVCGICIKGDKVLLIKHNMPDNKYLWAPPGGGVNYGETLEIALKREFVEETGLEVEVKRFLFVNELLVKPLHGIELFFEVKITGGELAMGTDPEMKGGKQVIDALEYLNFEQLKHEPISHLHNLFASCNSIEELLQLSGLKSFIR
ncbi:NUDIX domain-containing protein [Flammeovirgaceae bacterium SG7u.111]|nr:NUDIX domain-containing protein [Flammeovirgaceae bacterium SG7u.132]WPO34179.1 NUDIX domain-containing protein [Flammeovirgaceae bacterium SG7u.111]